MKSPLRLVNDQVNSQHDLDLQNMSANEHDSFLDL